MTKTNLSILAASAFLAAVPFVIPATAKDEQVPAVEAAKVKVANTVFSQMMSRALGAEGYDVEDLELWSQHILESELDAATDGAQRTAAYQAHLQRTTELARITSSYAKTGQGRQSDALAAEWYRLDAQSRLDEAPRP